MKRKYWITFQAEAAGMKFLGDMQAATDDSGLTTEFLHSVQAGASAAIEAKLRRICKENDITDTKLVNEECVVKHVYIMACVPLDDKVDLPTECAPGTPASTPASTPAGDDCPPA